VLHFIDDLDSKINQFRNQRRKSPMEIQYLRGLGRHVYLPVEGEPPEDDHDDHGDDGAEADTTDDTPSLF